MKKIIISIFMLLLVTLDCNAATKYFKYQTSEGFNMTGSIYLPSTSAPKVPLVILLHSLGGNKNEWGNLPETLSQKGYACCALDLRGHGQSIYNAFLKQKTWMYFIDRDFAKYPTDVVKAVETIKTSYKKVDTTKIAIVGTNIGANTAVLSANILNRKGYSVKTLALISPRQNIKGLYIPFEMVKFGNRPVIIFCNKKVPKDYSESLEIKRHCDGICSFKVLDTTGMANSMYKHTPSIKNDIISWICTHLK